MFVSKPDRKFKRMGEYQTMDMVPKDGTAVEIAYLDGDTPAPGLYRWARTSLGDSMWQNVEKPKLFIWPGALDRYRWRLPPAAAPVVPQRSAQASLDGFWSALLRRFKILTGPTAR